MTFRRIGPLSSTPLHLGLECALLFFKMNICKNLKITFIGGIFLPSNIDAIVKNSKGLIQNAANAYQNGILFGLSRSKLSGIKLFNMPFIGSYPFYFKKPIFGRGECILFNSINAKNIPFLNLFLIKHISRFISLTAAFIMDKTRSQDDVLIVYSAHTPFMTASVLAKVISPKIKIGIIIPDLPQYMSQRRPLLLEMMKKIDEKLFKYLIKKFDFYIVLTSEMIDYLEIQKNKSIVIEGVLFDKDVSLERECDNRKYIMYSGDLSKKYGIDVLVDGFEMIKNKNIELWIFGDGEDRNYIINASIKNKKIKYFGQKIRSEVLAYQKSALILVNPRSNNGDYTRFSFPSKTIEYMNSGRPVIMNRLSGVPVEYYNFVFSPINSTSIALADCINTIDALGDAAQAEIGNRAKKFIQENKNPEKQAEKILQLICNLTEKS